jgi:hypothetical protein
MNRPSHMCMHGCVISVTINSWLLMRSSSYHYTDTNSATYRVYIEPFDSNTFYSLYKLQTVSNTFIISYKILADLVDFVNGWQIIESLNF